MQLANFLLPTILDTADAIATLLQAVETVSIIGLAGLAVFGSVEAYRLQQAKKKVTEEFEATSE